ncbi:MAG TPA: undecaprenyl-diphosphate phosphatase [Lachnospiraceae bacterium]|nr:undecaprenyl-diphosphate phosphatase [Lachnospiraceae bacterium]
MPEMLKVIILGIVEGITEWLPISSTGHMILVEEFIELDVRPEFLEMFRVVIQLGAIMAVVVLYWNRLWPFHLKRSGGRSWFANRCESGMGKKLQDFADSYVDMGKIVLWLKIVVSCLPAMVFGLLLDDWMDEHLYNYVVVAIALIVYGVLFIVIENYNKRRQPKMTKLKQISFLTALYIGVFQVLALIPGTSRSGSTIIGGILLGTSRELAAEFTFFLAIPVMAGASLLKLMKFGFAFESQEIAILLVGMVVAFLVSILAIRFLMGYIKKHDFKAFGWYRIVLGILVLGYFAVQNLGA